jgi:formiminotetrahydrofolate cyclodeaminase
LGLLERSVADFLDAVASEAEPVPAGACAAALTGAVSAALVVLVCRVLQRRRNAPDVAGLLAQAAALQTRLAELIDADAAAFDAYTSAPESTKTQKLLDATRTPLDIAAACVDAVAAARALSPLATRSVRSDAAVAERLAESAARAALDTAGSNLATLADSPGRASLQDEWESLRARLP